MASRLWPVLYDPDLCCTVFDSGSTEITTEDGERWDRAEWVGDDQWVVTRGARQRFVYADRVNFRVTDRVRFLADREAEVAGRGPSSAASSSPASD
jgi:hypothetical protein